PKACAQADTSVSEALDLKALLDQYSVSYKVVPRENMTVYQLAQCPFNPEHTNSGFLAFPGGSLGFQCFHDSCKDQTFKSALAKITGKDGLDSLDSPDEILRDINQKHAVVNINGKFVVLNEKRNPLTGLNEVTFSSVGDFKNF